MYSARILSRLMRWIKEECTVWCNVAHLHQSVLDGFLGGWEGDWGRSAWSCCTRNVPRIKFIWMGGKETVSEVKDSAVYHFALFFLPCSTVFFFPCSVVTEVFLFFSGVGSARSGVGSACWINLLAAALSTCIAGCSLFALILSMYTLTRSYQHHSHHSHAYQFLHDGVLQWRYSLCP